MSEGGEATSDESSSRNVFEGCSNPTREDESDTVCLSKTRALQRPNDGLSKCRR